MYSEFRDLGLKLSCTPTRHLVLEEITRLLTSLSLNFLICKMEANNFPQIVIVKFK